jgi:hypothetical protein
MLQLQVHSPDQLQSTQHWRNEGTERSSEQAAIFSPHTGQWNERGPDAENLIMKGNIMGNKNVYTSEARNKLPYVELFNSLRQFSRDQQFYELNGKDG